MPRLAAAAATAALLLAASGGASAASAGGAASDAPAAAGLADLDDECLASPEGAEACALSAVQRRGFLTRGAEVHVGAPDYGRQPDDGAPMDDEASAELESDDDEYLPDEPDHDDASKDGMPPMDVPDEAGAEYGPEPKKDDAASKEGMPPVDVPDEPGAEYGPDPKEETVAALQQLQYAARANASWVEGVDKQAVTNCHVPGGNACPHGETCVVKHDKTWSQCVDCHKQAFGRECQKMPDDMRWAAIHTCKRTCLDTMCYNKNWCLKPYRCVMDEARTWGQCVSCHSKKFWHASCHALKPNILEAAMETCHHRKCKE